MRPLVYDPSKYDVPNGQYLCRLVEIKDKEPFKDSKYGNQEPRLGWRFEVLGPPGCESIGKVLEENTGTEPTPRSNLTRLLTLLLGRMPQPKERIDPAAFVGRDYNILWTTNPKSEQGRSHVGSLMAVNPGQPQATPPHMPAPPGTGAGARVPVPTPPPPPAPEAPAAPNSSIAPIFWVHLNDGKTVEMSRETLKASIDAGTIPVDEKRVMDQARMTDGWRKASDFGFKAHDPF